jgi:hypothetical protein
MKRQGVTSRVGAFSGLRRELRRRGAYDDHGVEDSELATEIDADSWSGVPSDRELEPVGRPDSGNGDPQARIERVGRHLRVKATSQWFEWTLWRRHDADQPFTRALVLANHNARRYYW